MGVRENKVETYFKGRVKSELKGISRKWVSPGHDGVPDQIPVWPKSPGNVYVEVKTIDGELSPVQSREHERLREMGALVFTVWGEAGVDLFIYYAKSGWLKDLHESEVYTFK